MKILPILILLSLSSSILAMEPNCSTADEAKKAEQQINITIQEVKIDQRNKETELDKLLDGKSKSLGWSKDRRISLMSSIMRSPKFSEFEKEKKPYTAELLNILMTGMSSDPKGNKVTCDAIKRLQVIIPKVKEINERQYAFMAEEIRSAK